MRKLIVCSLFAFISLACSDNTVENSCQLNGTFRFCEIINIEASWGLILDSAGNAPEVNYPDIETVTTIFEGMLIDIKTDPTKCEAYQISIQGGETLENCIYKFSTGTRTTTCSLENNLIHIDHCEPVESFIVNFDEESLIITFAIVIRTDDIINPVCEDIIYLSGFQFTIRLNGNCEQSSP